MGEGVPLGLPPDYSSPRLVGGARQRRTLRAPLRRSRFLGSAFLFPPQLSEFIKSSVTSTQLIFPPSGQIESHYLVEGAGVSFWGCRSISHPRALQLGWTLCALARRAGVGGQTEESLGRLVHLEQKG